jgi:prevent-host-death family protein
MNKHSRIWSSQEAKAKFSELLRRAQAEGPQEITLHGKHVATVVPAVMSPTVGQKLSGQLLIDAVRACPYIDEYPLVAPGEPMIINEPLDI